MIRRGLLALLLAAALATDARAEDVHATLKKNGKPLADKDVVTLKNGVKVPAKAYETILEAYLERLHAAGRIAIDTKSKRVVARPLKDTAAIAKTEALARASSNRAALRTKIARPAATSSLTFLPPALAVPRAKMGSRLDPYQGGWSDSWGDKRYAALDVSTSSNVLSGTQQMSYAADFTSKVSALGKSYALVGANVSATNDGGGTAAAYVDLLDTTYWALPRTYAASLNKNISWSLPTEKSIAKVDWYAAGVIHVEIDLRAKFTVGVEANVSTFDKTSNTLAQGTLRSLVVTSGTKQIGAGKYSGAYASVGLDCTGNARLRLRDVADELGVELALEALDVIPGVDIPWDQNLASAGVGFQVDLVNAQMEFFASNQLVYSSTGPQSGSYKLQGTTGSWITIRAVTNAKVTANASISYPSGVDIDTCWGIPCGLKLDWKTLDLGGTLFESHGALFDREVPIYGEYWSDPVPTTGIN